MSPSSKGTIYIYIYIYIYTLFNSGTDNYKSDEGGLEEIQKKHARLRFNFNEHILIYEMVSIPQADIII